MTKEDYFRLENEAVQEFNAKIHELKTGYVVSNSRFKVGEFIQNVTGIIKVERIGYENMMGFIDIVYHGYRYKKENGELIRTKDKEMSFLRESNQLKSLN